MKKQDLTEYSSAELSMWVFNDESLYRLRKRKAALIETLNDFFVFTEEQLEELLTDLENEEEE